MKKNLIYLLMIVLSAAFLFGSCAQEDLYIDDIEDDTPLQVYLIYFNLYEKDAINKYNIEVEYNKAFNRKIEITEFEYEEIENMYNRISNEMMSGKGPDIIFFSEMSAYYLDLAKMAEQNAFADMDILIENSDTFNFDDYNKGALDAGIIDGKRVMMPISYKVNYIVTTQENLDTINISIPDYFTYEKYFEIVEKCHNDTNSVGAIYSSRQLLYNIITKEGLKTEGISYLKKLMELEKEDNKRIELLGDINGGVEDFYQYISKGDILMNYSGNTGGIVEFELLGNLYSIVENLYNKDFVIKNEPTMTSETSYAYIDFGCAINMNSVHKNDAFEFVEYLLSEKCQYSETLSTQTLPVNKASFEEAKEDFINDEYADPNKGNMFGYVLTPMPDDLKNYYINLVEGVSEYKYAGTEIYILKHVIGDTIDDYKNDKIDFYTMVDEINRKIELYYSE